MPVPDSSAEGESGAIEPCITLRSEDLLSRWGFNDGEPPEEWLAYCEGRGIDPKTLDYPLVQLVRTYLLPAIEQDIVALELSTNHNPIQAELVDGADMVEVRHGRAPAPTLTPESVKVSLAEVFRLAQRASSERARRSSTGMTGLPKDALRALDELSLLVMAEVTDPAKVRRCAELFEFLDQPGEPRRSAEWWRRAAALGDEDAQDMLRLLTEEGLAGPHLRSVKD